MTVDNGSTKADDDSKFIGSAWSPGELERIGEDEISRGSGSGLENRMASSGKTSPALNLGQDSQSGLQKSKDEVEAEYGSWSLRSLLGSQRKSSEDESTEGKFQGKKGRPKKVKEEPKNGGELELAVDNETGYRSSSLRNLLGSRRNDNENGDVLNSSPSPGRKTRNGKVESNTGSPLRHGSPLRQGSPLAQGSPLRQGSPIAERFVKPVKKLLTPSMSFARIKEEKEEKSRMTPSPEELTLRDGINLPLIGQVRWEELKRDAITWLKNPKNLVLLVWIIAVAVSGAILFMVMVGMLNAVLPKKSDRDLWFEISNQILNALFTLMVLYLHPTRILHLIYLIRWNPGDIIKLRKTYCKDGLRKPHEWFHILVVVLLLHLNCFGQYALCGLNWGYRRANRPAIGVGITLATAFGASATAGIYNSLSPLGKDYFPEYDEAAKLEDGDLIDKMDRVESGYSSSNHPPLFKLHNPKYKLLEKRKSFASREGRPAQDPQWEGGLFDCYEEPTISILSTACFPCVMGWNYERLGFGNRYVHIATFLLLLVAPFLVFNLAAINVDNGYVRTSLGVAGIILCVFSLLYGGFWRIKIRERYKLPAHAWCCKQPNMSDCFQWLFCAFCSLCQEVRTAEAYDIRNDKFFIRSIAEVHAPGSSSDRGEQGNNMDLPIPASFIQPLPNSTMIPIKESDLLASQKPILSPPPGQTFDRLETHHKAHNTKTVEEVRDDYLQ